MSDWISDYLTYTSLQESPQRFHRWCALSIIAATLNRRCWLDRRSSEGVVYFTNYPGQLSVCLVAGAGRCKKSTAVNIAKPFMKEAGVNVFEGKITPERLLTKLGSMPGSRPVLTVIASELSTFLSKASYNDGMIDNLLKLLDCESNPYETQKATILLNNPCLTLLMATTPFNMGKAIPPQAHDSGFLSRHIFVYSDKPGAAQPLSSNEDEIDPETSAAANALRSSLVSKLRLFASLSGPFKWTSEGRKWFDNYYSEYRDGPSSEGEGYPQRRPDHLTRVAMCIEVALGGKLLLTERSLALADAWLTEIESDMPRAFTFIGQHVDTEKQDRLLKIFRQRAFETGKKHPIIPGQELHYLTARFLSLKDLTETIHSFLQAGILMNMKDPTDPKDTNKYIMMMEPY